MSKKDKIERLLAQAQDFEKRYIKIGIPIMAGSDEKVKEEFETKDNPLLQTYLDHIRHHKRQLEQPHPKDREVSATNNFFKRADELFKGIEEKYQQKPEKVEKAEPPTPTKRG